MFYHTVYGDSRVALVSLDPAIGGTLGFIHPSRKAMDEKAYLEAHGKNRFPTGITSNTDGSIGLSFLVENNQEIKALKKRLKEVELKVSKLKTV